jgi:hypothetical protein
MGSVVRQTDRQTRQALRIFRLKYSVQPIAAVVGEHANSHRSLGIRQCDWASIYWA